LKFVFCGYNPSLTSGCSGHHYAHPGNRLWRVLLASGITTRLYKPEEDEKLLGLGIGFTNLRSRPTRSADEVTWKEIRVGALALQEKLEHFEPRAVSYTGLSLAPFVSLSHNQLDKGHFMEVVAARARLRCPAPTVRFCKARAACTTARLAFLLLAFLWRVEPAPEPVS
jgi:Uracil DNA glycosylase superfamily